MKKPICNFKNEKEAQALVLDSERAFESRLDASVEQIVSTPGLRLLTVSGPSCSGKTTASQKIDDAIEADGRAVHTISIDDFFLERSLLLSRAEQAGKKPDFDSPEAIDHAALSAVIDRVFLGGDIEVPIFDFKSGSRVGYRTIRAPKENDVFLFEGIQAVYPSVTELFRGHPICSVYISVEDSVGDGGVSFSCHELRFLRRLVRDHLFRGTEPEFTFHIWETVRKNEEENILPYAKDCRVRINSYLPYELNMGKPYTMPLLAAIPPESIYYGAAQDLRRRLEGIREISQAYLPPRSLFREFLG